MKTGFAHRTDQVIGLVLGTLMLMGVLAVFRGHALKASPQEVEAARQHAPHDGSFASRLVQAALGRTLYVVRYDGAYLKIPYPNGDVPENTGVCTDEVIRSYRALGFDLQKLVHEDMKAHFKAYSQQWGLPGPDANIDHRRVPNLQTFFKRQGAALPVSSKPEDYLPGDLVTCTVAGHLPHIMLVVPNPQGEGRPWVVHNIGEGPQYEDRLFEFPLTGHYRWHPK